MKLSFGLIGGGGISHSHIFGATFEDLAVLKAGCFSRDKEKNLQFGNRYNLEHERIYDDYEMMAKTESKGQAKLDFVIVATPNVSHFEICKEFLLKGISVVCDKPLTVKTAQAKEIEKIAAEKNLLCATTYTFGGLPFIHLMRELYESGEIGNAYFLNLKYYKGARLAEIITNDIKPWRFIKSISGLGGTIADLGTHVEYIARFTMNCDIKKVLAKLIKKPGSVELDTTGTVLLEFKNGLDGSISFSQAACGHRNDFEVEILGDRGTLFWNFENCDMVKVDYLDGRTVIYRDPGIKNSSVREFDHKKEVYVNSLVTGFVNVYSGFIKTLISQKENKNLSYYYPTLTDGVKGVRFVEACIKSQANKNQWVEL